MSTRPPLDVEFPARDFPLDARCPDGQSPIEYPPLTG